MKKVVTLLAALVLCISSQNAFAQGPPTGIVFTSTIDDFQFLGPDQQVGSVFKLRNVVVEATFTGDVQGKATYTAGYSINLANNHATLSGTIVVETTGGLCVGTFEGHFNGQSDYNPETGDLYPDRGRIFLHGSNDTGCAGYKIEANFFETDPIGIFAIGGDVVDTP